MSGSKRKTRSLKRNIEEESVVWKPFIKTLEKPIVPNHLLEYLLTSGKQKLAAPSAFILCFDCGERSSVFRERYQREDREPKSSKITRELEDSDETVFSSSSDNDEWQISAELPHSAEEQLDFYLRDFDILILNTASFKSYKKATPFTDMDEYTRRVFDYLIFGKPDLHNDQLPNKHSMQGVKFRILAEGKKTRIGSKADGFNYSISVMEIVGRGIYLEERYPGSLCQQGC
ncbi:2323_t:CDS:2 [Gigaspora rosea]|nr:2323_t:CDS:2 [Gigaspora rosea]